MWISVLWAGLRAAMWITHVGGKFRHGMLASHWKEVIQLKIFWELSSQWKSLFNFILKLSRISFYLNSEMSTLLGPRFCLPSSRVLGQPSSCEAGWLSVACKKDRRCQLRHPVCKKFDLKRSQLEFLSELCFEINHLNFNLKCFRN